MTARQRLQADSDLNKWHQNLVDSVQWRTAADLALLGVVERLPDTTDPVAAAAAHSFLMGARAALATFDQLSKQPALTPSIASANLNHRA